MKTIIIKKPNDVSVIKEFLPSSKKGDLLLRVKYCGFCGTDVLTYKGENFFAPYPCIPGHEISAIVKEAPNSSAFHRGQNVSVLPYFNCEECKSCKNNKPNACEKNQTMGVQRRGAFSDYISVPENKIIDGGILQGKILILVEPLSVALHAIKRGRVQKGEKVLIIGDGTIGILCAFVAKLKGAIVFMSGHHDEKLKIAKSLCVEKIINTNKEYLSKFLSEEMDVVIEASGFGFLDCIEKVCYTGKIILVGNGKHISFINQTDLVKKEIDLYASRNAVFEDFVEAVEILTKNDLSSIITNIFSMNEIKEAFEELKNNRSCIKAVLKI